MSSFGYQFANNPIATLASGITSTATSCAVTSGEGALFPALTGTQVFAATIVKSSDATVFEIVLVTARSTDTMTIVRAQEGTTALAWNAGDTFTLLITAGGLASFSQAADTQYQAGNYAIDSGSANQYAVNLSPAITAYQIGMPVRFIALHTNTSAACTLSVNGLSIETLALGNLSANFPMPIGAIRAGGLYTAYWNGSIFVCPDADVSLATWGVHKAANTNRTNTTTLVADPDLVVEALAPGAYRVAGTLFFNQAAPGSAGIKIYLAYTGTGSGGLLGIKGSVDGTAYTASGGLNSYNIQILTVSTISTTGIFDFLTLDGTLIVSTAGSYIVQWAQDVSSATATLMCAGSNLSLTLIN